MIISLVLATSSREKILTQNLNAYNRRKYGKGPGGSFSSSLKTGNRDTGPGPVTVEKWPGLTEKEKYEKMVHLAQRVKMDELWRWFDREGHKKMSEDAFLKWATKKIMELNIPRMEDDDTPLSPPTTKIRIIRQGVAINYRNEEDNPFF